MRPLALPTRCLQAVVALIGAGTLAFMLWEPHLEGRNAHASLSDIYFKDPFLACVYAGSIPFYAALYHAFTALGRIGRDGAFTPETADALRKIGYCAFATTGIIVALDVHLLIAARGNGEDAAGAVALGMVAALGSAATGAAALAFERACRNGAGR